MNRLNFLVAIAWMVISDIAMCDDLTGNDNISIHGQATNITEYHPPFNAQYSGVNSLSNKSETANTNTMTLFLGYQVCDGTEIYIDPEAVQGGGFSATFGGGSFPDGEASRANANNPLYSISRAYVKQTFGFGGGIEHMEDGPNQVKTHYDVDRLTVVVGKFSLTDFFDNNKYAKDPRTDFSNWSFMANGAWDYAANLQGYTSGFMVEFNTKYWALRFASVEEPTKASQSYMDLGNYPTKVSGNNLELEVRYSLFGKGGVAKVMAYDNINAGESYSQAIATNDWSLSNPQNTTAQKYGYTLNLQQDITSDLGAFSRVGWNNGQTESWAFTEVDQTASGGLVEKGTIWGRPEDKIGVGYIWNGLSPEHAQFLADGGDGIMLGDGTLNYAPEQTAEAYYSFQVTKHLAISPDVQYILNPGYNADRGPVMVYGIRTHLEF